MVTPGGGAEQTTGSEGQRRRGSRGGEPGRGRRPRASSPRHDRVVLGDGFSGSRLDPQEGEAVRCIFLEHGGPEPQRPRKAVLENPGPASGVPPHRRAEDLARQATCRPVSGTKRSQEHSEASVSRVYRR